MDLCGGLTQARCQVPTKAPLPLPSQLDKRGKIQQKAHGLR